MRGIQDEENTHDLQRDGQQVIFPQRLVQDDMRRRHSKHGIARIDDRCSRGIHVQHRHLQKRHVQQDRQKAHQHKIAVVRAREPDVSLFQILQGERQQSDRADEHALDRHLHGRKRVTQSLEHNFRRGVQHCRDQNEQISAFPVRHLLPPRSARSGTVSLYAAACENARKSVLPWAKNAALLCRAAFWRCSGKFTWQPWPSCSPTW